MRCIYLALLLSSAFSTHAQDSIVRYWKMNKYTGRPDIPGTYGELAHTRSVYRFENDVWKMESRYIASGRLYMKATYKDAEATIPFIIRMENYHKKAIIRKASTMACWKAGLRTEKKKIRFS